MMKEIKSNIHPDLASAIVFDPLIVSATTTVREAIVLMSQGRSSCGAMGASSTDSFSTNSNSGLSQVQREARSSCVIVLESAQRSAPVLGILTERDVVRLCSQQRSLADLPVGRVMTTSVFSLQASAFTDLFSAINLLQQHHIRHLPIVDDQNALLGIVTHETLRHLLDPTDLLRLRLVEEVMTAAVVTAAPTDSLLAVAQQMAEHRISSVVVVDPVELPAPEGGLIPIGVITERDLVQFQALELNFGDYAVAQVMNAPVITAAATETLVRVQALMDRYLVCRVVVIGNRGELQGIVTQTDVLQAFNPLELYKLTELLEAKVKRLETEKIELLENQNLQLEEREAALQDFLDNANDLIQMVNIDTGHFEFVNRTWRKVLGYRGAEVAALTIFDVLAPDCHCHCQSLLAEMRSGSCIQVEEVELTLIAKSGQAIVVEGSMNCRFGVDGEGRFRPVSTRAILRDITDRKLATDAIEAENAFRNLILENLTDGLCVCHGCPDYPFVKFTVWNPQMEVITGYSQAEINALGWYQTLYPDPEVQARAIDRMNAMRQGQHIQQEEWTIRHRDGSDRILAITTSLLPGQTHVLGVMQDITERKAAELLIQQQAAQETLLRQITQRIRQSLDLQTIFDTGCQEIRRALQSDRVGIYKFYPETHHNEGEFIAESIVSEFPSVLAVPVHDRCFGETYAARYAQGQYFAVDDIDNPGLEACHRNILAQFHVRASLVLPLQCGSELWGLLCIHQCSAPRHWTDSEITFSQQLAAQLGIAIQQASLYDQVQTELQERQRAQHLLTERNEQLALTNLELERATRLKDEFLANMSHELRTPLNSILGMTEAVKEEVFGIINDKQSTALDTVEKSAQHLLSLINDILDVSKIASGNVKLDCSRVAVQQLCASSLTFVKQQALKKRIQLYTQISPNLPHIFVDEVRIRQVLLNLLTNAVKFTPEGGSVTLSASSVSLAPETPETSTYLRLTVTDTGIGIAPENMGKLFQPFVQIDGALNRKQMGTGLGLALVKQLVELHGGQVNLSSTLGGGSCFSIDLPYRSETGKLVCVRENASHPLAMDGSDGFDASDSLDGFDGSHSRSASAPLVLLAEDNPDNIHTISCYLEAKGYQLLVATNGQEAIDLSASQHPDIILMDVQMPGMDGLEAMKRIRQQDSIQAIPIIALTALAMEGDRERCLAAGANTYLSKPVKLKQLDTFIKELLC